MSSTKASIKYRLDTCASRTHAAQTNLQRNKVSWQVPCFFLHVHRCLVGVVGYILYDYLQQYHIGGKILPHRLVLFHNDYSMPYLKLQHLLAQWVRLIVLLRHKKKSGAFILPYSLMQGLDSPCKLNKENNNPTWMYFVLYEYKPRRAFFPHYSDLQFQ